jgi:ribosome-associated protein
MAESAKFAKIAYDALADKKGEDIKIIDISNISPIADYFIIANGSNQNQLQAMCDAVEEELYKAGCKLRQTEGNRNSTWILMDYGDVVVHVFSREDRLFYDLERIWTDGTEVAVENL